MTDAVNAVDTTVYLPSLVEELTEPDEVSVRLDIIVNGGTLNFLMVDTTPWPPGSDGRAVTTDDDGNTCLVVERGRDRIFNFELSPDWRWTFDPKTNHGGIPMTFKKGDAHLYRVEDVKGSTLKVFAKARPHMPTGGARDYFNLDVLFEQDNGPPIPVRIDPITDNPPLRP